MRIYLDACSLQRPLDDRSQPRVNVEAEAVLTVLGLVESGQVELLSSDAIEFEIGRMPDAERQSRAREMLKLACQTLKLVDNVQAYAQELAGLGVKPMDSLHLAFASWARADFFCTCDDKLVKKAKKLNNLNTTVVTPLQLIAEVAS
jgi:predicted nucleic acid-binding protein